MRVFPIPPKDVKRILLDYTIPLESGGGECRFRLPLFSDLEPIWDFRLTGVIRAAVRPDGATSPSHPAVKFQRDADGTVRFELAGQNVQAGVRLSSELRGASDGGADGSRLRRRAVVRAAVRLVRTVLDASPAGCTSRRRFRDDERSIPPAMRPARTKAAPPADVLVLVDTSASMRDCPLVRRTLGDVLHKLRPADRFRVACVDVAARAAGRPMADGRRARSRAGACAVRSRVLPRRDRFRRRPGRGDRPVRREVAPAATGDLPWRRRADRRRRQDGRARRAAGTLPARGTCAAGGRAGSRQRQGADVDGRDRPGVRRTGVRPGRLGDGRPGPRRLAWLGLAQSRANRQDRSRRRRGGGPVLPDRLAPRSARSTSSVASARGRSCGWR